MLPRNVNVIMIALFVSLLCYSTAARSKKAILVGEAITLIDRYYVDPVDDAKLVEAAMTGLTSQLDEHSEFIPPGMYGAFQDVIEQEFAGVGILVEQPEKGKPVRVITPLVGSPALAAGIMPRDEILKVNDRDVSKMEIGEVSDLLRGPVGTEISVSVQREDKGASKVVDIKLLRKTIELESVTGEYRDENNRWVYHLKDHPEIAYVRLTSFGEKTVAELKQVLDTLDNQFESLILDVRANSGGLLYAAVEVCDDFLETGRIVSIKKRGGEIDSEFDAGAGVKVRNDIPVVVLIDGNSASASEIVAACLQDHGRAKIVGSRSFGKGTVQNVLSLDYGRSALKLTTARYFRPNGKNIHRLRDAKPEDEWGVSPDPGMDVTIDDEAYKTLVQQWQKSSFPVMSQEQSNGDSPPSATVADPQLQRAVEVLTQDAEPSAKPAESRKAA
jgi:carboxyl-terminal processing protease